MRQNRQEDYMDKILDLCKDLAVQSGVKIMEIYDTYFEVYSKEESHR